MRTGFAGDFEKAFGTAHVECSGGDFGGQACDGVQDAEIEGRDEDALVQVVAADDCQDHSCELLRRRSQVGLLGIGLHFDIEDEGAPGGQVEDLIECGEQGLGGGQIADVATFELGIVGDHEDVVAGDGYVELDGIDADGDGVFKAGERVFRQDGARAAMAVDGDGTGCIIARYKFQSPAGILDFSAELRGKDTR